LCATLKKHLKGVHFTSDEEVQAATGKWFQEQFKVSTVTGLKNLLIAGGIVSNKWETMRKNEL
jgi:hypothetical protein